MHEDEPMEVEDIELPSRISTPIARISTPVTRISTPVETEPVVDAVEPFLTKFEQEDIESENTSNVISIPDTDPLPHNMSGDLMAMVSEVTRPMDLEDLQTQMSPVIKLQVHQVIIFVHFKSFQKK